jgi:hypothetical protein
VTEYDSLELAQNAFMAVEESLLGILDDDQVHVAAPRGFIPGN